MGRRIQAVTGIAFVAAGLSVLIGPILVPLHAQQGDAPVWISAGPTPLTYLGGLSNPANFNSGRVASIAIDPSDPKHWLIGAGNGGVWQSSDGGANWVPLSDSRPTLSIGAVAFAPSNPSVIYVGTGEPDPGAGGGFGQTGLGLVKSIDGGATWNLLAGSQFARATVKRIRVNPSDPKILLAGTSRGGFGRDSQEGAPSAPATFLRARLLSR